MTIKGLDYAIEIAIDRCRRTKDMILIVQVGENEYILWRAKTRALIPEAYPHYRIVKAIQLRENDVR